MFKAKTMAKASDVKAKDSDVKAKTKTFTKRPTHPIQSVLNVAARIVYGQACFEHITPTLRDRLHWLRKRTSKNRVQAMLTRIQGAT